MASLRSLPQALLSPKGGPLSYSPLWTPKSQLLPDEYALDGGKFERTLSGSTQATMTPMTPVLALLPDPYAFDGLKFERSLSATSTQVPEYHQDEDLIPKGVLCIGLPALESELGRWAEATVRAKEWLGERLHLLRHSSCAGTYAEFLVDNNELRAETSGLAYRRSKDDWDLEDDVLGPAWGETVAGYDQGDGWVKVGNLFLPIEVDGMIVLTQKRALDMEGCAGEVVCVGMPRLQSELGRWAESVVSAEEWLEQEMRKQQEASWSSTSPAEYVVDNEALRADTTGLALRCSKDLLDRDDSVAGPAWGDSVQGVDLGDGWVKVGDHFLPREIDGMVVLTPTGAGDQRWQQFTCETARRKEYLLDNSYLQADTTGLAFRCSKDLDDQDDTLAGPTWGQTVAGYDLGDGWLKVGEYYLPMEVDGMKVLMEQVEPLRDGPALTAEGIALDLEDGAPIFFTTRAGGAAEKALLKATYRAMQHDEAKDVKADPGQDDGAARKEAVKERLLEVRRRQEEHPSGGVLVVDGLGVVHL